MSYKNVWILNHYAQEPGGPGGTRHFSLARHLQPHGWKAWIIAASVELNTGRQRLPGPDPHRLQSFDDVPFLWLKTPTYRGNGPGRVMNMAAYTLRSVLPASTRDLPTPHVVVGSSVHPLAAIAGWVLARRHRVPFVFEVRDLWPQTLIDLGRIAATGPVARILRAIEKWLYQRSDLVLVLLPRAAEYIAPLGIPVDKIFYLPNGCDVAGFPAFPARPSGVFTVMYFGAFGTANGLDNVIDAMQLVRQRAPEARIVLRLIGDGPHKQALQERARSMALENLVFQDPVPKSDIPRIAAEADAFVFNLVDAPVFRYGISSNKLFDFMAAARPVIFCCSSGNNPIADCDAGITVRPGDPAALADAIVALARTDPESRARMGANARRYVEHKHTHEVLAANLASALDRLTRSGS